MEKTIFKLISFVLVFSRITAAEDQSGIFYVFFFTWQLYLQVLFSVRSFTLTLDHKMYRERIHFNFIFAFI